MRKGSKLLAPRKVTWKKMICKQCGKEFSGTRQCDFCSNPCRRHAWFKENYIPSPHKHLDRANTGAISELRVAVDLLSKNFEVFRALSPHCSCDLAVLKDGKLLRIEVRTGRAAGNGKSMFWTKPKKDKTRYDIFAVVLEDRILYTPQLS